MIVAWDNAVFATPAGLFLSDLGRAIGNGENDHAAAARYWLSLMGADENPWPVWDANIGALERIDRVWPVMHKAAETLDASEILPRLARFVCDRIPAAMTELVDLPHKEPEGVNYEWLPHEEPEGMNYGWFSPVTRCLVLADRAHDLVGLMHAGVKVTGSGDAHGLRRMAKHWIIAATIGS